MQETRVRSLGQKDALEKGIATHSSIPAWRIPWTEEPGDSTWGCKESDTTEWLTYEAIILFLWLLWSVNNIALSYAHTDGLDQGSANFSHEEPHGIYFQLCRSCLCPDFSALWMQCQGNPRWAWWRSNKTLFIKKKQTVGHIWPTCHSLPTTGSRIKGTRVQFPIDVIYW